MLKMDLGTKTQTKGKSTKSSRSRWVQSVDRTIPIQGSSLQDTFKKSLRGLGHVLSPGSCSSATHYDCIMKVEIKASGHKALLVEFLEKVLRLTYSHKAIFCTMHVEEITNTKLVAQLYGTWFKSFDTQVKSLISDKCILKENEDHSYKGVCVFQT